MDNLNQKIDAMRAGGRILANTHAYIAESIHEGMNAFILDRMIHDFIVSNDAVPGFLGYQGYKYSSCISKNEEIVHGIPYDSKLFFNGDLISIDVGVLYQGYYVDAARSYLIGDVDDTIQRLANVTEASFFNGISSISAGSRLGDLSNGIQSHVESNGFSVVKDLYSHGVGKNLHEDPLIPNYGKAGSGIELMNGMTLAIEPMVNIGTPDIVTLEDNWTIITADRQWSAHYENTILITDDGVEILTL